MKLYFTVSSGNENSQNKTSSSLGGFKSSTVVQNDVDGNVFDEISLSQMSKQKTEYIALVLKNQLGVEAKNVQFWFETPENSYCSYQIGATTMLLTEEGFPYMERVETIYSRPFQTTLYSATVIDKVSIGDMAIDQTIGLWISRSYLKDVIEQDYNDVAERDLETLSRYKRIEKEIEESIGLQISWD